MGNFADTPVKVGPNPYTRSGIPPPKLNIWKGKNKDTPIHRVHEPMSLELHMGDERVRTAGLSQVEREWRQKFLQDQHLHPDEPIHVDAVHRQLNPVRVLYRWPWDKLYMHFLRPTFGPYWGTMMRIYIPKYMLWYIYASIGWYVIKYEKKNWQKMNGFIWGPRKAYFPLYNDDTDEDTLRKGLPRPDVYEFMDVDFVHFIHDFDAGVTKRPCMLTARYYTANILCKPFCYQMSILMSETTNSKQHDNQSFLREGTYKKRRKSKNIWMLAIPFTTFYLGCWQWKRHIWKTNLLRDIHNGINAPAVDFPINNINALDKMEYRKVHIRGKYLYGKQFLIKWRQRLDSGKKSNSYDNRLSKIGSKSVESDGAQVITPLQIDGSNLVIMVNRGWIPYIKIEDEMKMSKKREPLKAEFDAIVRKSEKPNLFLKNEPSKGIWVYKDLNQMADLCEAAPILVDAVYHSSDENEHGPIGGQTNINLKNDHFSYMLQW